MGRTFIPRLIYLIRVVCVYITRYRQQLNENLPPAAIPYLDEIMNACEALIAEVDVPTGP
jgi:hypothetical protein